MDDIEVWGERALLVFKAAQEINETGEVCVDTFMRVTARYIKPEEVARALKRIHEQEELEHDEDAVQEEENE